MKKLVLMLAVAFSMSFFACGNKEQATEAEVEATPVEEVAVVEEEEVAAPEAENTEATEEAAPEATEEAPAAE